MNTRIFSFLLFASFMFYCGCIPLNSHDITDLRGQAAHLQIEYKELKQNQTDLQAKISSMADSLEAVNTLSRGLEAKISSLNQNITCLDHDTAGDVKESKDITVLPSLVYQSAYSDYTAGKYELAYSGFQSFIEKYPDNELVSNAQFYLGECFYSRKLWTEAVKEYEKVENISGTKPDLILSAKFKIALCCENLGLKEEALKLFSSIVEKFPNSSESVTAREKIKIYTGDAENK
ncbi:MAG: tetratricopeptide repeat protein [Endomicrobium sp.]|jgi:tol-pal system protein YbgF|nr:tetratricopeptide repeat protein [Endomicrobium sp.]